MAAARPPVLGNGGIVASSQRVASEIGRDVLAGGGNAADAALAMAAALAVCEPCSTGIGGDVFVLHYDAARRRVDALNGSGRSPAGLTLAALPGGRLPERHAHTVTVPGAIAAWCDLSSRHGSRPLAALLAPAIALAEGGFEVAPFTAAGWALSEGLLRDARGGRALLVDGQRAPAAGTRFVNPDLARTLAGVARDGPDGFYRGPVAEAIAAAVGAAGGTLSTDDLRAHRTRLETPISATYRDVRVWQCPPNGQGLTVLLALGLLEGFDLAGLDPLGAARWHLLIEALRLAFADAHRFVADPDTSPAPLAALLDARRTAGRRRQIDPARATLSQTPGDLAGAAGTVYFCAVDAAGNACSMIASNYMGFGTGIVPDGGGFSLQNRGHNFSLDPTHPNALGPGRRPYHTIIPGLLTRADDDALVGPIGVMGGFMQPQGQVQLIVGLIDDELDPQAALDRPRFLIADGRPDGPLQLEAGLPARLASALRQRGHPVVAGLAGPDRARFGRGQAILRQADGRLIAGSDRRADGCALAAPRP